MELSTGSMVLNRVDSVTLGTIEHYRDGYRRVSRANILREATCDMISRESHVRNEEGYIPNHLVSFRMGKAAPTPGLLLPHHRYLFLDQAPEMKPKAYFFSPFVVL
ncbi:hypothetical protein BHE74_00036779 [Ensete ventricosum]|nr:hypothetical protein GW17_00021718 [Ensete ventricosum]RWW56507.1 hypothetical protein BHE74_00036779 [Ensete ventricosum]